MKPEANAIKRIHRCLSKGTYKQAMGLTSTNGTPDYYYDTFTGDGWVEYKWSPNICTINLTDLKSKPSLSKLQQRWINRAYHNNRLVMVAVCFPEGVLALENLQWIEELTPKFIRERMHTYADFASYLESDFLHWWEPPAF